MGYMDQQQEPFWPFVSPTDRPGPNTPLDPVNLLFFGNASAENVARYLMGLSCRWHLYRHWRETTFSHQALAFIDDRDYGGKADWVAPTPRGGLELGRPLPARLHMRIFESFADAHPVYGKWCIGAVHQEHVSFLRPGKRWADHSVSSWLAPRGFLHGCFIRHPAVAGLRVERMDWFEVGNEGDYQGVWFDGRILKVKLD